jgi:hypothetical protein
MRCQKKTRWQKALPAVSCFLPCPIIGTTSYVPTHFYRPRKLLTIGSRYVRRYEPELPNQISPKPPFLNWKN